MWLPATGTCHIPCRAEKGSSSSSQAADENASPRIPLLHLTGWVPGDVGVSTSMVCLPPQARLRFCASPRPAQPVPGSRWSSALELPGYTPVQPFQSQVSKVNFSEVLADLSWGMLIITGLSAAFLKTPLVQTFKTDLHTGQPGVPESGQYQNQ